MGSADLLPAMLAGFILLAENRDLTAAGWTVMLLSVGSVLTLVTYCVTRVMRLPPVDVEEHLKGPLEIDTGDTGEN